MATNFPTSLDSYTNVADGDTIQISTTNNMQDAVEALEAKVGIDSSAVTSSHDYKIGAIETILGSASTADLTKLHGVTATKDELNILDGVTATKDELNILDGVTATKDELNILDGVTATKDELNILDGVTATTSELNKLDADSSYNCSFRAYVNETQYDVTGDMTNCDIVGTFFTESFDDGANFSNGIFTAPVTSNKYNFGLMLTMDNITSSHLSLNVALVTTSKIYFVYRINPSNIATDHIVRIPCYIGNIPMSATDTAYWRIYVASGDKIVDLSDNYTEVWGGLSL